MTGVAAILRFALPGLDDISEENVDSDDEKNENLFLDGESSFDDADNFDSNSENKSSNFDEE
jgi:hypothetical protein